MAAVMSVREDRVTIAAKCRSHHDKQNSRELILGNKRGRGIDGRPRNNATQAKDGGPGGKLIVELSESNRSQGAICVRPVAPSPLLQPPLPIEVPVGKNLVLTAIGGDGEPGGTGGDGQNERDGRDGLNASRHSPATNGANGDCGGNAGEGSNGGDGGHGGATLIIVNKDNTHLLLAVSCDVSGGKGGAPGKHGRAGISGNGGKAGESYIGKGTQSEGSFSRKSGWNGLKGSPGIDCINIAKSLRSGRPGKSGRSRIAVTHVNGPNSIYSPEVDLMSFLHSFRKSSSTV